MAPSVLGIGIPASMAPFIARGSLQRSLDAMEKDMNASSYDWDMLYITPDQPFDLFTSKLREKKWDVVMIGMGVRKTDALVPFFERIVNAVHKELPETKFSFNENIEKTREGIDRVVGSKE